MSLASLDHCSIRTVKLEETRNFYVNILGMTDGDRPDFPFPGAWLYIGDVAVIHLIAVDPKDPSGLLFHLGGELSAEKLQGSGAVDHIAFQAKNPEQLIDRLKKNNCAYREREVPNMNIFQVFTEDPNGVMIELNYSN
ncbi:MAG: glyoxalase [Acidiferrobacteraceae bacterium]|nr:glyoxalase [Acidiferrobacteraceae bacterium]